MPGNAAFQAKLLVIHLICATTHAQAQPHTQHTNKAKATSEREEKGRMREVSCCPERAGRLMGGRAVGRGRPRPRIERAEAERGRVWPRVVSQGAARRAGRQPLLAIKRELFLSRREE